MKQKEIVGEYKAKGKERNDLAGLRKLNPQLVAKDSEIVSIRYF